MKIIVYNNALKSRHKNMIRETASLTMSNTARALNLKLKSIPGSRIMIRNTAISAAFAIARLRVHSFLLSFLTDSETMNPVSVSISKINSNTVI